tara:strand:- start:1428 stop:1721 length:294 start_codon:yes stop_codon:yes gene_type:complete
MGININKPLTGGTGSVTTGSRVGETGSAGSSQKDDIETVLTALQSVGIINAFQTFSRADTPKMTGRHLITISADRKEAVDSAIDVVNQLDNKLIVGS